MSTLESLIQTYFHLFNRPPITDGDTRRVYHPPHPNDTPLSLFQIATNQCSVPGQRYIRINDQSQALIFCDGACVGSNRTPNARAGFGVLFRTERNISCRLELDGPQASNRAELRAMIAALQVRVWVGEGFTKLVLACDSEYVVLGVSEKMATWRANGWKTSRGTPIPHQDLWEILDAELKKSDESGLLVQFWYIPKELNAGADALARAGAMMNNVNSSFTEVVLFDL